MRSLESSHVTYTSDVLKCTVVKVEGLQMGARRKPCIAEVTYGPVVRCTDRQRPSTEQGHAECVACLLIFCLHVLTRVCRCAQPAVIGGSVIYEETSHDMSLTPSGGLLGTYKAAHHAVS